MKCGGNVVITEAYNSGDVDFRAQLTKIANTDFDALFIPANYKEVGLLQIRQETWALRSS